AVGGVGELRAGVCGVGVVDVAARPVGEDEIDEARLLLGGRLLLLHVLEAAGVAERTLRLVVPADPRGAVRLVGVDEQERRQDRVGVGLVLDGDPVLGFDAHHLRHRHGAPGTAGREGTQPRGGGTQGRRNAYRYWPVLITRSTALCFSLVSPIRGLT